MDVFVGLEDGDVVVGVLDTKSALVRDWYSVDTGQI
jgi:hypothetical protein